MKKIKRLAGLLLALIMVMGMSLTALATEADGNKPETPRTYKIYQIFTGDYVEATTGSTETLTNLVWGKNGSDKVSGENVVGTAVSSAVTDELKAVIGKSDAEKLKVITKYLTNKDTPFMTGSETTYTGLPAGYYLVEDVTDLSGTEEANNLSVVQVVNGTLSITEKRDVPKVEKKIKEGTTNLVDANSASIGKEVEYEITGTLPEQYEAYTAYYYKFTDTLSKGLTYKEGSFKIQADGKDVTGVTPVVTPNAAGTSIVVEFQDLKTVVPNLTKDSQIIITYTATLNENAIIAGNGNPNTVKLEYSNNPNDTSGGTKGETPEDKVVTYTTELTILKKDKDGEILPGVEFTLTGSGVKQVLVVSGERYEEAADGTYYKLKNGDYTETAPTEETAGQYESTEVKYKKNGYVLKGEGAGEGNTDVVGVVSENGKLTFSGLGEGEYVLQETKPLPGYNTIPDIKFNITGSLQDGGSYKFVVGGEDAGKITLEKDNTLMTEIINTKDVQLPSTGGIGTTIFYIIGGVLVVAAGILLVVKKRMQAE